MSKGLLVSTQSGRIFPYSTGLAARGDMKHARSMREAERLQEQAASGDFSTYEDDIPAEPADMDDDALVARVRAVRDTDLLDRLGDALDTAMDALETEPSPAEPPPEDTGGEGDGQESDKSPDSAGDDVLSALTRRINESSDKNELEAIALEEFDQDIDKRLGLQKLRDELLQLAIEKYGDGGE